MTPGVSFVKSRKLWLAFGRFWTAAESMSVDPAVRLISTTGASPVTRTSCCTGEISSVSRRFTSWPTDRFRPSRTTVVKPGMLAVIRYGPSGSRIARNRPAVSVTSVFSKFVAVFRSTTVAPGRAASLGSTTVPEMTPVVACDWDKPGAERTRRRVRAAREARHHVFATGTSLLQKRSVSSVLLR